VIPLITIAQADSVAVMPCTCLDDTGFSIFTVCSHPEKFQRKTPATLARVPFSFLGVGVYRCSSRNIAAIPPLNAAIEMRTPESNRSPWGLATMIAIVQNVNAMAAKNVSNTARVCIG
tara:strand:+ start:484 stop:837 length:354 start_codon:yes stop_codon:yes gene_type:complete